MEAGSAPTRGRLGQYPKIGRLGRMIASTLSPCGSGVIVLSFLLGLAATTAAVALATGPATSRLEARSVTSIDQLRGVSFVSSCAFSHRAPDDPIVYPGRPGASHDHTFLGSKTTDAFSTDATLRAAATTCKRRGETAAYWVPTLVSLASGSAQAVVPAAASAYYRRDTIEDVQPFPPDLRMIAGSSLATTPQPLSVTRWDCGIEAHVRGLERIRPTCPPGPRTALRLHVSFPDCWDGQNLDTTTTTPTWPMTSRATARRSTRSRYPRSS